jgi:raffinose/stachyose/melibiose transport system permease protein
MTAVPFVRSSRTRAQRPRRLAPLIPHPGGGSTGRYWLYLIPGLVLVTGVIVVPVGWNIYLTFTSWRGIKPPKWIGLANWQRLLQDDKFWTSFSNSIWMIVAMVIVPTVIGLVIAALLFDVLGRKFGRGTASLLRAAYYLPQILPVVIAGIVIGWILRPRDGALNTLLSSIGLGNLAQNWLGDPKTALGSMMVVLVWAQIGYPVVIFMAALQRVDPQLYEAAELDGANWFQRFRSITIGTITPEIFVVTLTCTIAALKVFGPIYVLTRGGPGTSTIVPSYYSYSQFFQAQQVGYGATIATALTVVIAIVAIVFVKAQNALEAREQAGA